jgi:hypothetical protein
MSSPSALNKRLAGVCGFVAGVTLATAALVQVGTPAGAPAGGLDLAVRASQTGELAVSRAERPLARRRGLRAGTGSAAGATTVRNQTPVPLFVTVSARSETADLDDALAIVVQAGGRTVYRGSVSGLRRGSASWTMVSGGRTTLRVRAWLPSGARSGWEGRQVDLGLELSSLPARSRSS